MHRSSRRLILVALLLAVVLAPGLALASQPVPAGASPSALAVLTSPGDSLARLWAWVMNLLPGHRQDRAPMTTRPATGKSWGVRPDDGSALDPNG
jgi:hypothetical protein